MENHHTNRMMDRLPAEELSHLIASTESVQLLNREMLYEPGVRPRYAYFITDGIASIVTNTINGNTAEVGIVGREGLVGALHLLGRLVIPTTCFMQIAGAARRMPMAALERMFLDSPPMHSRVLEYIQLGSINSAQLTACNGLHTVEQRLARWLLMVQDRMQADQYAITHEFLADMLVAHRPTVSIAASAMQRDGLISYRHGHVRILNRERLCAVSCECYKISFDLLRHLYS